MKAKNGGMAEVDGRGEGIEGGSSDEQLLDGECNVMKFNVEMFVSFTKNYVVITWR